MTDIKRTSVLTCMVLAGLLALTFGSITVRAATTLPATIIDDFEDGDATDWVFFGGNNAGGGGGTATEHPREGNYYLSTGWGGDGSASSFYGGMFTNLDNAAQVTPPADPWFNVWVYAQSDSSADQFRLEITLREDLDGNGWTNGSEDSLRLDTTIASADFNDQWVLISAPLSGFVDQFTGGDGTFNGLLDEVVIVIAGVEGAPGALVEVDFDQLSFTSGGPAFTPFTLFDDMEHGDPFGNGWFSFNGAVGGGGIAAIDSDLPPADGGAFALQSGWGSGGVAGFYGGFGRTNPIDLSATDHFNFWINPASGQDYTLEINLQEDDSGDNAVNNLDNDDEFQYNCVVSPIGPCAISGGGWQLVSIPLADFFDDNSFFTAGNGVLDAVSAANGGNGQLINMVLAVLGNSGSEVNFGTDFWAFSNGSLAAPEPSQIVDDFEYDSGLPTGADGNGVPLGFYTFSDGSPIAIALSDSPPAPVPAAAGGNRVLAMFADIEAFAGVIHGFENGALDTWVAQDWSAYEGLRLWLFGNNTGSTLFVDVIDNRNPGSTSDDAERFSVSLVDDFSGWQLLEFPFSDFVRKEIGNGAPNDGFSLTQVYGWALGALQTPGPVTYYVDDISLYGTAAIPELAVNFSAGGFNFEEGSTGTVSVKLNRPMNSDDPAQVSVDYATGAGPATPGLDYSPVAGTLTFVNGGPSELSFTLPTFDDSKWEGNELIALKLSNPQDVALGLAAQAAAYIIENDAYDPNLLADFEQFPYLWKAEASSTLSLLQLAAGDPLARPGQDAIEGVLAVDSPVIVDVRIKGNLCQRQDKYDKHDNRGKYDKHGKHGNGLVPAIILTTATFDALSVDHTTVTLGKASEAHINKRTGVARRHEQDVDRDGDLDLVLHFREREIDPHCRAGGPVLAGQTFAGQAIASAGRGTRLSQDFAIGQDWSQGEALAFWYYGSGSGAPVKVLLKDNRAADPGPQGWGLVWSEEFNGPAGTPPKGENWSFEIGDGSLSGIPGWGNEELQYYTDDPANAATDGQGNMVITVREADGSLDCYYGPCEYTSARLISKRKAEFAYGRVEARIRVPQGGGIWPAFWSLGTDIDLVQWPQTGEIDFMEFVGRLPNEIFGTIHGPGYSGGQSFAGIYDFGEPVYNDYHTFTIEWQPDQIQWYVDGILYHTAAPGDVAPNPWVFNDPVFLLLNVAIGGNFGGAVDPDIPLPQSMAVDYIRVYQAPDSAERFEASFVDDVAGWRQVAVPFADFSRKARQPAGAPDDGLNLTEVWGYGFALPQGGPLLLDQVRVQLPPPPVALTVNTLADSGPGSLRQALRDIAAGGVISFDASLAGSTIALTSGQLLAERDLTIDASAASGIVLSGNSSSRVLEISAGASVALNDLVVADGVGAPQGGGILNLGNLSLTRVVVRNNTETSAAPANFAFGGGGIYSGDGATLNLTDSTVADNATLNQPGGGLFGFFNSTINITRSTVSGNVAADLAGGLRSLGNANVLNSTFSGNTSTVWHGGGIFHTDGQLNVTNSTFSANVAPAGTASGIVVATFGAPANLTLSNTIIEGLGGATACAIEGGGAATINSGGHNVASDNSCNLVAAGDQAATDPLVAPLAANGGPTHTHALQAGSPAIDAADSAQCPASDQRGVARPQGAGCDVGAFELAP